MNQDKFRIAADQALLQTVNRHGGVPGVVAMATDRQGNFYEGAAGSRELGREAPMTTDSVFAIFSTTKALTATCLMQLVWIGRIVETLRGKRLGEVMRERIFAPLEMQDTGFTLSDSMRARRVTIHDRAADGRLTPVPDLVLPQPPEMDCGGHGLYATVGDYMKFIRMLLNDGAGPAGRVLKAETVAMMSRDGLGTLNCTGWTTPIPSLSNSGEFFPGLDKGWAYSFMTNREDAPSGRPAGSLMWTGLANSYHWIDRRSGIGGYWAAQILPFQDCAAYPGFVEFETAVYHHHT